MNSEEIKNSRNPKELLRIFCKKLTALVIAGSIGVTAASVFTEVSKFLSKTDSAKESISEKELKELQDKCDSIVERLDNQEEIEKTIDQLESFINTRDTLSSKQNNIDILEIARLFNSGDISFIKQSSAFEEGINYRIDKIITNNSFIHEHGKIYSELDIKAFTNAIYDLLKDEDGLIPDELKAKFDESLQEGNSEQNAEEIVWAALYYCMKYLGMEQDEIAQYGSAVVSENNDARTAFKLDLRSYAQGVKFKPGNKINVRLPESFKNVNVSCIEEKKNSPYPKYENGEGYKTNFEKKHGKNPDIYTLQGRY